MDSKMNSEKKGNIGKVVRRVILPSKIVGLFPLRIDEGDYRVDRRLLVVSVGVCAFFTILSIYFLFTITGKSKNIHLNIGILCLDMILMNSICLVTIYEIVNSLTIFNNCISELEKAENDLSELRRKSTYSSSFRPFCLNAIFACGALFFGILKNTLKGEDIGKTTLELIYFAGMLIHMITAVHRYAGLLGITGSLFVSCNKEASASSMYSPSYTMSRLETLISVHHKLCGSSTRLSNSQTCHILLIILTSFVIFVSELYKLYEYIQQDEPCSLVYLIVKTSWIGVCFNLCLQIVSACEKCKTEAKEFNTLLYQLMIDDKTNDISNNKKLRLHIAMKREVVFTACGFFNLDYSLVHSMIAAATTYLVILIQFGQPEPQKIVTEITTTPG